MIILLRRILFLSASNWSGLISSYYVPRWKLFYEAKKAGKAFNLSAWEERWIKRVASISSHPYKDPLTAANRLSSRYNMVMAPTNNTQ